MPAEILPCFVSLPFGTFRFTTEINEQDENAAILVGDRFDVSSWFLSSSYSFLS